MLLRTWNGDEGIYLGERMSLCRQESDEDLGSGTWKTRPRQVEHPDCVHRGR
jgi:hypothetical protein